MLAERTAAPSRSGAAVSLAISVKSQARRVAKEADKLRRMAAQLADAVLEESKDTLEGDTDEPGTDR